MDKVLLVGSHHGHEKFGDALIKYIRQSRPDLLDKVDFIIANPKAHRKNVRQIESDMNRSYNGQNTTYEEKLATTMLKNITAAGYIFALDLHTTTLRQLPAIITANLDQAMRFINASRIKNVIIMPTSIANVSFIGNVPNSVSIEIYEGDNTNTRLLNSVCDDILRLILGQKAMADHIFFRVYDYLLGQEISENDASELVNFKMSKLGFIPIMVGEKSYDKNKYIGFKAICNC